MTKVVVGNGIHLPSLVVSTVGVVSPTVLDATDSGSETETVVAADWKRFQSFHMPFTCLDKELRKRFPPSCSGRSCYRNTRLKATLHI